MTPSMVRQSATTYDVIAIKRRRTLVGGVVLFFDLIKIDQITGLDVYILSDLIKLYHPLAKVSQAPLFNFQVCPFAKLEWEKSHSRAYLHQRQEASKTANLTGMRRNPDTKE
jgi:hypothetical protein